MKTASAYVITDRDDNQLAAFQLGAMRRATPVGRLPGSAKFGIVSPGNPSTMMHLARACRRSGIPFLFDPGQVIPIIKRDALSWFLRTCTGLIGNDYEMKLISKQLGRSVNAVHFQPEFTITTLGARGSTLTRRRKQIHIRAAKPISNLDPTGAGDAYRAGLMAGLIRGYDLETSAQMGAVASVYTVERVGTQTHRFTRAQFVRRYQKNFGQKIQLG